MKPKSRKLLLEQLGQIDAFVKKYPTAKVLFGDAIQDIEALHKEVLYERVEKRQGGLDLNAAKIRGVRDFAAAVVDLKTGLMADLNCTTGGELWITKEALQKADLKAAFVTQIDLFQPLVDAVHAVLQAVGGTGISKAELCKQLQAAVQPFYKLIDVNKLTQTTSLIAINRLDIPVIDQFIDRYKKYKGLNYQELGPDYVGFCKAIDELFVDAAMLTQSDFEKAVQHWQTVMDTVLGTTAKDKLAAAGMHVKQLVQVVNQQFASMPEKAFQLLKDELVGHIESAGSSENLTVQTFAEQLQANLKAFAIPVLNTTHKAALGDTAAVKATLEKIDLKGAIMAAVDINSPVYVVSQPNFIENLTKSLNAWKDALCHALVEGADLILKLDGCVVNGASFKKGILDCIKIDSVAQKLNALTFEELQLRGHKDLSVFNEKWGAPWEAAIKSIDVTTAIIDAYKEDASMLTQLYQDLYRFLPSHDHVIAMLNLAVGGKINLALEAVGKLSKRVDNISEEVELIKKVNDLQSLSLGYNSMITEIDIVYKGIIEAHKNYVHKVHLYCAEYANAYSYVEVALKEFNDKSNELKAFREALFDTFTSIATTALIATGVGGVGVLVSKMAVAIGKEVAEAVVTEGIKMTLELSGAKSAAVGDYPQLKNTNTEPFMEYLSKQLEGERVVLDALATILDISSKVQECNAYIQFALDEKIEVDIEMLTDLYNNLTNEVSNWLQTQKQTINSYVKAMSKLNPLPNVTRNTLERNMYVQVIEGNLQGVKSGNNWQIICDAKENFRPRLLFCNLIREDDFIDNWYYDTGWEDELIYLYNQKAISLFK